MSQFKLGVKAVVTDSRTLPFSRYAKTLAPPPPSADWTKGVTDFGMMLNDTLGDCTIAAVGHAVQIMTLNASTEVTVPDQVVQNYYQWWDGYVPGDPSTDNGGIPIQVLNKWRKHTFNGHKLTSYVGCDIENLAEIRQSISLFSGNYISLKIPNYVMNDLTAPGSIWDVEADDGLAGLHAIWGVKYTSDPELITFISWGGLYSMTIPFWQQNVLDSHCLLSPDWFNWSTRLSASGFNFNHLWQDLAAL